MENKKNSFFDTEKFKGDMKQRAIKGGIITSLSQGILFLLGMTSTVVLARMLMPEHFGLIGMVMAITVLIERFQDIGLGDAIVQKKEITHEQVSTLFWINSGICLLIASLIALSSKAVAWFYDDSRLVWITVALASNFIFSGLSIQQMALIRRRMRFDHFALIKVLSAAIGLVTGIVLAWMGYGYWALVWKELARSLFICIFAWLLCPWRPGLPVRNAGVMSMLKFGGNVTGFNIFYYLSNNLDSILLGKFFGAVPVGLYTRGKQLTTVPISQMLEPIRYVSLPTLSALQNDPAKYRNYFIKMLGILSFLYMPIIVYICVYANPIVYIALGSKWMDVVPIFRLLSTSMFITPIIVLLGMMMLSFGNSKRYLIWGLFTSSSIMIAFIIGIRWGAIGIATSWPIATAVNLIFSIFFVFKGTPVTTGTMLSNIYKPAIASAVMGIVLLVTFDYLIHFHISIQILISFFIGATTYLAVWVIFPNGYKNIMEFISYPISVFKKKNNNGK